MKTYTVIMLGILVIAMVLLFDSIYSPHQMTRQETIVAIIEDCTFK